MLLLDMGLTRNRKLGVTMSSEDYGANLSLEQQAKIKEIKDSLGRLPEKLSIYCSDASITRYLVARNWDVKKAMKMLKSSLKWRLEYKPEEIRWEEIAKEAETGKIYRPDIVDKHGRSVLVMRPRCQNTKSARGQVKYLVYCMENAILNLLPDQEQMVWLIDFDGFNLSNVSIKVTKETAHVLQDHYPERLGLAILYNPPRFFEPFWKLAKPFLEPKTCAKVKFAYPDDPGSMQMMQDLFDVDKLEHAFGGNNQTSFNVNDYAKRMREDDKRMPLFWSRGSSTGCLETPPAAMPFLNSDDMVLDTHELHEEPKEEGEDDDDATSNNELDLKHSTDSPVKEELDLKHSTGSPVKEKGHLDGQVREESVKSKIEEES